MGDVRRRRFRRVAVSVLAAVLLAVGVEWIDDYTAVRRSEAFHRRVGQIVKGCWSRKFGQSQVRPMKLKARPNLTACHNAVLPPRL